MHEIVSLPGDPRRPESRDVDDRAVRLRAVRVLRSDMPEEMPVHGERVYGAGYPEEERDIYQAEGRKERECGSGRRKACDGCREVRLLYALREEMPAGSDPCGKKRESLETG